MRGLMDWATPQQIISNALFDQGYRRWAVAIHAKNAVYSATVWARDAGTVQRFYWGQGAEMVEVEGLPLARFTAVVAGQESVMTKHGWDTVTRYTGDVILSDEFLEARKRAEGEQWEQGA